MPPKSEDSRRKRRAQLLTEARKVFAAKGYHATSISDIIAACGVARGTFYNYFDSKRAIFSAILEDLFERMWHAVEPISVEPGQDILGAIAANIRSVMHTLDNNPDMVRILFNDAVGLDADNDNALVSFYNRSRERLENALRIGQQLGIIAEGNPQALAISVIGMVREYWFQRSIGAELIAPDEFLLEIYKLWQHGVLKTSNLVLVPE